MKKKGNKGRDYQAVQLGETSVSPQTLVKSQRGKNKNTENSVDWKKVNIGRQKFRRNQRKAKIKTQKKRDYISRVHRNDIVDYKV
jgi:hypothetical protein